MEVLNALSSWITLCFYNRRCKKLHSNNITYYFSLLLLPICRLMAHMVLILVNTPRVFLKYSEQLDKCQLIQHNANITCTKCNGGPGIIWVVHNLSWRDFCSLDNILICMGHIFVGCLRKLCNTTFCIIEAGCCLFLKGLECNKKSLTIFVLSGSYLFLICICIIPQKNLERLYERIHRLMILWREVFELVVTKFKK
jgi:hypothetical protein